MSDYDCSPLVSSVSRANRKLDPRAQTDRQDRKTIFGEPKYPMNLYELHGDYSQSTMVRQIRPIGTARHSSEESGQSVPSRNLAGTCWTNFAEREDPVGKALPSGPRL